MIEITKPEQDKLINSIKEITNSMIRMEGERELIKEILADIKEKTKISPTTIRKLVTYILDTEKKTKADEEIDIIDFLLGIVK